MKIVGLRAENILGLKVVNIDIDGKSVVIGGDNGAGKSSLLNAIYWTLGGKKVQASKPIREGEEFAEVSMDLGDYKVTKRWTEKGETLKIENQEGARYGSPQKLLDSFLSDFGADLSQVLSMKPKDQAKAVARALGIEEALEDLRGERVSAADERKRIKQEGAALVAVERDIPCVLKDTPDEPVEMQDLIDQRDASKAEVAFRAALQEGIERLEEIISSTPETYRVKFIEIESQISDHQAMIKKLNGEKDALAQVAKMEIEEAQLAIDRDREDLKKPHVHPSVQEIEEEIENAETLNESVRLKKAKGKAKEAVEKKTAEFMKADVAVKAIDDTIATIIQEADLMEGLSINRDLALEYEGLPMDQLSQAEQIKVGIFIATTVNPKLRVLLIRDGSLMDPNTLQEVLSHIEGHDFQVWVERVSKGDECSIIIEDGEVKK